MVIRGLRLALLAAVASLASCGDPDARLVGKVASPDGEQVIALYYVVPGSIQREYLALNVAPPAASYAPRDSVASFRKATELRAYWTADGRPVVVVRSMDGSIFDDVPELLACVGAEITCDGPQPRGRSIAVRQFESGGQPPI